MLCFEGIAMNLNVFLERKEFPKWIVKEPAGGQLETLTVSEEVCTMLLVHWTASD